MSRPVEIGATQTLELDETLPAAAGVSEVTIEMAAGNLNVEPAADDKLSGRSGLQRACLEPNHYPRHRFIDHLAGP